MLDAELKVRAQDESKRRGITLSDLVDKALRRELGI
jgi:antitoxin component of RelBE/YafQ-DinJ toxin-antitoxin module